MSTEENKAIVRHFIEEVTKGNYDVIDEVVAPDFVDRSLLPGPSLKPCSARVLRGAPGSPLVYVDLLAP